MRWHSCRRSHPCPSEGKPKAVPQHSATSAYRPTTALTVGAAAPTLPRIENAGGRPLQTKQLVVARAARPNHAS